MSTQHHTSEEDLIFSQSIDLGVTEDKIDVANLWKWTIFTIVFVLGLIFTAAQLYSYYGYKMAESQAINTKYDTLVNAKESAKKQLATTGLIDESKGQYHIPIDKAIDLTVEAYKTK